MEKRYRITNPQGEVRENLTKEDVSNFKASKGGVVPEGYVLESYDVDVAEGTNEEPQPSAEQNQENLRPTTSQQREEAFGNDASILPYTADKLMRDGDWGVVPLVKDILSLPGRAITSYFTDNPMGTTSEEAASNGGASGLIQGITRSPWTLATAPLAGVGSGLSLLGRVGLQAGIGAGMTGLDVATKQEGYESEDPVLDILVGGALGAGFEGISSGVRELISRYGKEQARRIIEGMMFGNVNGARTLSGKDIASYLADPVHKEAFENALASVSRIGKRTTKVDEAAEAANERFLVNAKNRGESPNVNGVQDAEVAGVKKAGNNGLSADEGSTALDDDLVTTARTKPWDENAVAARNMIIHDPKRVEWKGYTYNKGGFTQGMSQSNKLTGYTKSNGARPGNIYPEEGAFLDELALYFDRVAKGQADRYNSLNIKGQLYEPSPEAVGKFFFEKYFKPLQEAAFSASGITENKLLDVMKIAARQNDEIAMGAILNAGKKLGFTDEQINKLYKDAVTSGTNTKLSELIKSGKDVSKYNGNLPVDIKLVSAKGLNPLAGISRLAGPMNSLADRLSVRNASMDVVGKKNVLPANMDYLLRAGLYGNTQDVKKK